MTEMQQPLFERIDGVAFFERIVDEFYEGVMADPVLAPLYEADDVDGARHRLSLFLAQYWGGPTTYLDERGHPKLRMRHFPFSIGAVERDRWVHHMLRAIERTTDDDQVRTMLIEYFVPAAEHLRNDTGLPISSAKLAP
jgi:hemoglobin